MYFKQWILSLLQQQQLKKHSFFVSARLCKMLIFYDKFFFESFLQNKTQIHRMKWLGIITI